MGGILGKVLDGVHSSVQCWGVVGAQRGLEEQGRRAPGSLAKGSVHAGHRVGEGPVTSRRLGFLAQPWDPWPSLEQALQTIALCCTADLLPAWTEWPKCVARARDSIQRGGWT